MPDTFEPLREIIRSARVEAQLSQSDSIGCEHLLAGCLQEGADHFAAHALRKLGLSLEGVRAIISPSTDYPTVILYFTPEVRYCIHGTFETMRTYQGSSPEPEMLFAALLFHISNQAPQLLQQLEVNFEALGRLLSQSLPGDDDHPASPPFTFAATRHNKFTQRARQVLLRSDEEAWLCEQSIDREHILLGLLYERTGIAFQILQGLSIDTPALELALTQMLAQRDRGKPILLPQAKRSVELAVKEAVRLRHHYLGTEHLLLGILSSCIDRNESGWLLRLGLRPNKDVGDALGKLLIHFNLTLERARRQTLLSLAAGQEL